MELPNTHAHTHEDTRTHTPPKKTIERVRKRTKRKPGKKGKKEEKERKSGEGAQEKMKEGGRWVQGVRGAWLLRRVGPHTNNARST